MEPHRDRKRRREPFTGKDFAPPWFQEAQAERSRSKDKAEALKSKMDLIFGGRITKREKGKRQAASVG